MRRNAVNVLSNKKTSALFDARYYLFLFMLDPPLGGFGICSCDLLGWCPAPTFLPEECCGLLDPAIHTATFSLFLNTTSAFWRA